MAAERTLPMQLIELHVDGLVTAIDFGAALNGAIGAPGSHGDSVDAFLDSMIYHDDINALKAPYPIRIVGADKAGPEAQDAMRLLALFIAQHAAVGKAIWRSPSWSKSRIGPGELAASRAATS